MTENLSGNSPANTKLLPTIGLTGLVIFGVGDMLGAGIYGLIGVGAGVMGNMLWLGFAVSMLAAMLTALSYATLGSRYPRAGGVAYVTERAFRSRYISYTAGLVVMASGLTSMAAASRAFAEYARPFLPFLPLEAIAIAFLSFLAFITFLGLKESGWVNALCTSIELGGLLFIISFGARYWGGVDLFDASSPSNPEGHLSVFLALQGGLLTFYAFVGFEDMLNLAEEVKDAPRVFPRGIIIAVVITSVIYIVVSITAVSVVSPTLLASSGGSVGSAQGPLVQVATTAAPWLPAWIFAIISLFAIANTALLNFIMSSRLSYGMARQKLLPSWLAQLHRTRHTPHLAVGVILLIVSSISFFGNLAALAAATSFLILLAFIAMNVALIVLLRRNGENKGKFEVPVVIPVLATALCTAMVVARLFSEDLVAVGIAAGLIVAISILYLIVHRNMPAAGVPNLEQ